MLKQVRAKTGVSIPGNAGRHAVNRAVADLRRGETVLLVDGETAVLIQAAETIDDTSLARAREQSGAVPLLATTRRRAIALNLTLPDESPSTTMLLMLPEPTTADLLNELADPTTARMEQDLAIEILAAEPKGVSDAAIELAKLARLLPAMVLFPMATPTARLMARREAIIELDIKAVFAHRSVLARTLRRVAEASVPLVDAETTVITAFRPDDGGTDHLAILIGKPVPTEPVLARIHSECFTGDLLGSLRCDCGEQLRGAIKAIAEAGGGILIYLAQEGRGIGLVNKLRAYQLQDQGFDTVDANEQLGFDADERVYQPAAEILRQLGFPRVRLMTNNPDKVAALAQHGIHVVERVPHIFAANDHNRHYLGTKAAKSGHLF